MKVADIFQYEESESNNRTDAHVEILYAVDKTNGADFLAALGLADGKNRYENADALDESKYFYQSDVLISALSSGLTANATTVKNAMECYAAANGTAMPLTDSYGKTKAENLPLGLYLVAETKVPEMVVSTTNPFLVSVPMTSVNGTNANDGGTRWIYDITLYPKNLTGIPSLEKTLREAKADTGKTDDYAHTGTASAGDTIDYQIISTLPSITSETTYLSCYTFVDTLSAGLTYTKGDVTLEIFSDTACKNAVTTWKEADGYFTVSYNDTKDGKTAMTVEMTAKGLAEINKSKTVYADAGMVNSGFSDCTMRLTYTAKVDSDNSLVVGDKGNDNKVVLTWKRTSETFYDTLVDDAHVYTYGIDLTKLFSDGKGDFSKVEFLVQNKTDNYYLQAEGKDGVYYVTGHTADKEKATAFIPGKDGHIIIKGVEDDTYIATEIETDEGYTLLRDNITVEITTKRTDRCARCNAPLLTASAEVNKDKVTMLKDGESANAIVPLTVVNTQGFNLPQTGSRGIWMYSVFGVIAMGAAAFMIFRLTRKQKSTE